jgi:hypothetical protein
MLKSALIAAAGAFTVAVLTTAVTGSAAMAAAPKCKVPGTNKLVACTDNLKSQTGQQANQIRTQPLWGVRARDRLMK